LTPIKRKGLRLIAVDGPAASGKGTLAKRVAQHFGFAYLDTGLIYRAVAAAVIENRGDVENQQDVLVAANQLVPLWLERENLRSEEVGLAASSIAEMPLVRTALINFQRSFATRPPQRKPGAVLDGRDIGTVICPNADKKIFVDAEISVRATRRVKELRYHGLDAIYSQILQDMRVRDDRDRSRDIAPLAPAIDAFVLDTTDLDADGTFEAALKYILSENKPA
jgi:cytidylate kinase